MPQGKLREAVFIHANLLALGLLGWFVLLALAECVLVPPQRDQSSNSRLITNFGLAAVVLSVGGLFPLAKLAASAAGQSLGLGLARVVALPWLALLALTLLAETFGSYWAHRAMHRLPLLWRIHRVHHADNAMDVSSSFRNHPLELLVTLPVSAAAVLIVGTPASVVIVAQSITGAAAIWAHADLALPPRLDKAVAWISFTPRLHRLHHNPERTTHDSNYGELLTLWDRLFGTFTDRSEREAVGLKDQVAEPDRLLQQIWSPVHAA